MLLYHILLTICSCYVISTFASDNHSSYKTSLLTDPSHNVIRDIAKEAMSTYMKAIQMRPDWLQVLLYNVKNESEIRKTKFGCPEKNEFCIYKLDFLAGDKAMELMEYLKAHRGELLFRMRRRAFSQAAFEGLPDSDSVNSPNEEQSDKKQQTPDNYAQYEEQKVVERVETASDHTNVQATLSRGCTEAEKESMCKDSHLCEYVFLLSQVVCKCRIGFTGYACNMFSLPETLTKLSPHRSSLVKFESLDEAEAEEIRSVLEALARYTLNAYVEQQLQQKIYG